MEITKKKAALKSGVARVPMVMQLEALECGAACLAMVLAYYEKWVPLEQVRVDCGVSRDGSKAKNIVRAARSYGLAVNAYRMSPEALREKANYYYRVWTNSRDFETLFLTIFAISETEQMVVE